MGIDIGEVHLSIVLTHPCAAVVLSAATWDCWEWDKASRLPFYERAIAGSDLKDISCSETGSLGSISLIR